MLGKAQPSASFGSPSVTWKPPSQIRRCHGNGRSAERRRGRTLFHATATASCHRAAEADRSGRLAAFEMTAQPGDRACLWCGRGFAPRSDGGKRQLFCRPACRRGFDAAGRRWVAEAIATGVLAVDALRNGPATTRALVRAPTSPTPVGDVPSQHPTSVASRVANSYRRQRDFELLMAKAIATRRR
jgi:hypothetical protein